MNEHINEQVRQLADESVEEVSNPTANESFAEVLTRRLDRRKFLQGAAATASLVAVEAVLGVQTAEAAAPLSFAPIQANSDDRITLPPGYAAQVVLRWGDPLLPDVPAFDVNNQSAANQARQFGYNNDFVGFFPFPQSPFSARAPRSLRGLLTVNHEYTDPLMMFPSYKVDTLTREQVDIQLAAHGVTVVEVV